MNKELILKYKAEFDHWLNGGSILCGTSHPVSGLNWTKTDSFEAFPDTILDYIIINDEYSHLRKALCDGKTIQICEVIEQHLSDSSEDIYGWKDFKSFTPSSQFGGPSHHYRIKQEEPELKVCDFVKDIISGKVSQVNNEDIVNGKYSQVTKWYPSHKELCYFTHDTNTKTSAILREFREISEDGFYVDCFGTRFIYCEPFLNSKPSWFKD